MKDVQESYEIAEGRISISARLVQAGTDACILVTGGTAPHIGAVAWATDGTTLMSANLPGHREKDVADIFMSTLAPLLRGTLLVAAGIHLDAIRKAEIEAVLALSRELAKRIARESGILSTLQAPATHKEKP